MIDYTQGGMQYGRPSQQDEAPVGGKYQPQSSDAIVVEVALHHQVNHNPDRKQQGNGHPVGCVVMCLYAWPLEDNALNSQTTQMKHSLNKICIIMLRISKTERCKMKICVEWTTNLRAC